MRKQRKPLDHAQSGAFRGMSTLSDATSPFNNTGVALTSPRTSIVSSASLALEEIGASTNTPRLGVGVKVE
jgi:hypothetical protein